MRRATGAAAERVSSRTGSTGGCRSNFRIIQTGGTPFGAFPLFIFQYRRLSSALTPPQRKQSPPLSGTFFRNHTRRSFPKSRTPNSLPAISPPSPSEHRCPASAGRRIPHLRVRAQSAVSSDAMLSGGVGSMKFTMSRNTLRHFSSASAPLPSP